MVDQPSVGVPGEPLAARLLGQAVHRLDVEPDVEDGLHHSRHGDGGPRPHRDEQRVGRVAEGPAHGLLQRGQVLAHLGVQLGWRAAVLEVVPAGIGGDREARRDGETEVGHLGQVRALAAEQILPVLVALAEVVDPRGGRSAGHRRHLRAGHPVRPPAEMVPHVGCPVSPFRPLAGAPHRPAHAGQQAVMARDRVSPLTRSGSSRCTGPRRPVRARTRSSDAPTPDPQGRRRRRPVPRCGRRRRPAAYR